MTIARIVDCISRTSGADSAGATRYRARSIHFERNPMQQFQRSTLCLTLWAAFAIVGTGLTVSTASAADAQEGEVVNESYSIHFAGKGDAQNAYDGTKDVLNWKPVESNGTQTDLRSIVLNSASSANNRIDSENGSVHVRLEKLELVNERNRANTIVLRDGQNDTSLSRDLTLELVGGKFVNWNIEVEEQVTKNSASSLDDAGVAQNVTLSGTILEGDIIHTSKSAELMGMNGVQAIQPGNDLEVWLKNGSTWTGSTYSMQQQLSPGSNTIQTIREDHIGANEINVGLLGNSRWNVAGDSEISALAMDSSSGVTILSGKDAPTTLKVGGLVSDAVVTLNDRTALKIGHAAEGLQGAGEGAQGHALTLHYNGLQNTTVEVNDSTLRTTLVADDSLRAAHEDNALIGQLASSITTTGKDPLAFELEADTFSNAVSGTFEKIEDGFNVISKNETVNPNARGVADAGSILMMQWRSETDDVMRRMSDLRGGAERGLWVRHYGGRQEVGSTKFDHLALQFGGDTLVHDGRVKVLTGAAFSYNDGDADFSTGSADAETYALTFYGELSTETGSYLNAALKYGVLKNDFDFGGNLGGTFRSDAWGVTLETGHRFALPMSFWVEPQLGFTWAKVEGDSFGVGDASVHQQSFESKVGSLGVAVGWKLPEDRGNLYVRAAMKHDWDGETSTGFYANGRRTNGFDKDLGGSWFEAGVGADMRITDALRGFAEFETAHSGEIDTPYRWNLGLRYAF